MMMIPIRCFSCGKPIAHLWEEFQKRVKKGEDIKKVLTDLGIRRYCCRSLFLGHIDVLEEVGQYKRF
jgi:DNA-directed RNA polymerase subunit N